MVLVLGIKIEMVPQVMKGQTSGSIWLRKGKARLATPIPTAGYGSRGIAQCYPTEEKMPLKSIVQTPFTKSFSVFNPDKLWKSPKIHIGVIAVMVVIEISAIPGSSPFLEPLSQKVAHLALSLGDRSLFL
jgi:hypothetical protein